MASRPVTKGAFGGQHPVPWFGPPALQACPPENFAIKGYHEIKGKGVFWAEKEGKCRTILHLSPLK